MDCCGFKDLLDSYLSQELAIETNHTIMRHAELCAGCRAEMAARRQLRETLRRACSQEKISEKAYDRLCARIRADAYGESPKDQEAASGSSELPGFVQRLLTSRLMSPVAAIAAVVLLSLGAWGIYQLLKSGQPAELSAALFDESAGDHRTCAVKFINSIGPAVMPESVKKYNPAYAELETVAESEGLQLRSAHLCGFGGRRFAHLVYTRNAQLISLLVTERDGRALKLGVVPTDDGSLKVMLRGSRDNLALGAYQTGRHIVLVVSDLSGAENEALAQRLAIPVAKHLLRVEKTSTALVSLGDARK